MTSDIRFRPDELVTIQGKTYPVVGGRLRIAHEVFGKMTLETEILGVEPGKRAEARCRLTTEKGTFTGHGAASLAKDQELSDSLLELAETRAVARALRFGGIGVEYIGIEELGRDPWANRAASAGPRNGDPSQPPPEEPLDEDGDPALSGADGPSASNGQIRFLLSLARQRRKWALRDLNGFAKERFSKPSVYKLTKSEASSLIDELLGKPSVRLGSVAG